MSPETIVGVSPARAAVRMPQHVVYRSFPAETVVLNLETGQYHGLNPTAGQMLEALQRTGSVRAAAAELAEGMREARSVVEQDLCELCEALQARGLIEIDGGAGS
jgi:hypothetical protein